MVVQEQGLSAAMNAKITGAVNGTTVVLAHGFGGDQSLWDKITPVLSRTHKVLSFDWPFSGAVAANDNKDDDDDARRSRSCYDPVKYGSYEAFADDLTGLLEENELKSTVFVGHSMSGMIGCIASVKKPELFERLILVAASPRYINTDDYEGGFKGSDIDSLISNIETNYFAWASSFPSLVVDAKDPHSVDRFEACLKRMRPEFALPLAKTVFYCDHREILADVETPCTIVQASNDVVVPNSVAYYMLEKMKGKSTVEIVENDGHFPQLTNHVQFINVLNGVLRL